MAEQRRLRIFLTGASSGIGAALARHYADAGATLGLVARRRRELEQLARELPMPCEVYATDVRAARGRVQAIRLPARAQPDVRYEIAVVARSESKPAARAWIRTLQTSARARRLLRDAGFGAP